MISLSLISALERSREFTAAVAEAVTKTSLTSSIESLTSVDASEFLTSSMTANEHAVQERPALIILITRNAVEVWHIARIEKRGGDLFLEKIDTFKVNYVTTSLKIHTVKSFKSDKCTQNKTHVTHLGISARLTAVALAELSDVSTVAKTLVEALK